MARENTRTGGKPATDAIVPGDVCISIGKPPKKAPPGYEWRALTSAARLETGHTPSRKKPEYWGGDVPWIGIRDATGNHGRVIHATNENTNALGISNSSARILPAETVCLSRTASVGYVVVMGRPMATSQDFVNWVCSDELNPHYLKYALLSEQRALRMFAVGSVHSTIYFPEVKAFHLCMPSRKVQDAVAATLGALDDKIELNRKMNATLEAMARALFRDWFVDFGPTRAKIEARAPYLSPDLWALFPDRLDAEGKPEGWEEKPLDEVADFLNGLALQKFPGEGEADSLPVIKIAELRNGITANSNRASRKVPSQYVIKDGDFLFSWSGSLLAKFWTGGEGALNQHLFKVTSDRYPAWFFSEWVQHHLEEFQIIAASKATTMGHIQRGHLKAAMTICPPDNTITRLGEVVAPLIDRIVRNELESRTLAQTRDLLLPRLMSGEIQLSNREGVV